MAGMFWYWTFSAWVMSLAGCAGCLVDGDVVDHSGLLVGVLAALLVLPLVAAHRPLLHG